MSKATSPPGVPSPKMVAGGADLGEVDGGDGAHAHAHAVASGGTPPMRTPVRKAGQASTDDRTPNVSSQGAASVTTTTKRGRSPGEETEGVSAGLQGQHQCSRARLSPSAMRGDDGDGAGTVEAPAEEGAAAGDGFDMLSAATQAERLWDDFQLDVVRALMRVIVRARKHRKIPGVGGFEAKVTRAIEEWICRGIDCIQDTRLRKREGKPAWPWPLDPRSQTQGIPAEQRSTAPEQQAGPTKTTAQGVSSATGQGMHIPASKPKPTAGSRTAANKQQKRKASAGKRGKPEASRRPGSAARGAGATRKQAKPGPGSTEAGDATAAAGSSSGRSYAQAAGVPKKATPPAKAYTTSTRHRQSDRGRAIGGRTRVAISGLLGDISVPLIRQACSFYGAVKIVVASNTCNEVFVEFESYSRDLAAAVAAGRFRGLNGASVSWARLSRRARQERLRKSGKVMSVRCQATVPRAVKWTAVKELLKSKGFARTYVYFASNRVVVVDLPNKADAERLRKALAEGIEAPKVRFQPKWSLRLQPEAQSHQRPQHRRYRAQPARARRQHRDNDDNYYKPLNREKASGHKEGQSQGGRA